MLLLNRLKPEELKRIKKLVGEAFVTNELFHDFGTESERHDIAVKYMGACVECVYESKALYGLEGGQGYIGVQRSSDKRMLPQLKMICRILHYVPYAKVKKLLHYIKQIAGSNAEYAGREHMETLFVCVPKDFQGQGYATRLVEFAKEKANEAGLPLLFDTDMKDYAEIYQHLGCELYHTVTADNGVTRYSLVWKPVKGEGKNSCGKMD